MTYFVFSFTEDGLYSHVYPSKEDLLRDMTPNEYGETELSGDDKLRFLSEMPEYLDECGIGLLVIKGEIVVPHPVNVVTQYDIK